MLFTEQEILENTYNLEAKVERYGSYEDDWGETKQGLNTVYESVNCAVEQASKRNITNTLTKTEVEYDTTLLCSPNYVIKTGDTITVAFINGGKREFTAGEPYYFSSHTEVPLVREVDA